MKHVVTVTLNPAVERTIEIPNFLPGKAYIKEAEKVTAGGKGVNVSRALKCFNIPALATGILGGCSGKVAILKMLRKERINQDFYKFGGYSRTNVTIIDSKAGHPTQLLENGPKISPAQVEGFKEKYIHQLIKADFVVLAGRNAFGVRDRLYAELVRAAQKNNIPVLLDSHGPALVFGIKAKPTVVTPNINEAQRIVGKKLSSKKTLKYALQFIVELGSQIAVITLGKEGAVAFNGRDMVMAKPPLIKPCNVVGCGDAFNAGFVAATLKGQDFINVMRCAVACATASALTFLPGKFNMTDYQKILKKICVKKL